MIEQITSCLFSCSEIRTQAIAFNVFMSFLLLCIGNSFSTSSNFKFTCTTFLEKKKKNTFIYKKRKYSNIKMQKIRGRKR
jgi:hypothetical protein